MCVCVCVCVHVCVCSKGELREDEEGVEGRRKEKGTEAVNRERKVRDAAPIFMPSKTNCIPKKFFQPFLIHLPQCCYLRLQLGNSWPDLLSTSVACSSARGESVASFPGLMFSL